ncbi:uncharacterized protein METZ01_LOCUS244181, partial [marine metagenome]
LDYRPGQYRWVTPVGRCLLDSRFWRDHTRKASSSVSRMPTNKAPRTAAHQRDSQRCYCPQA